MAAPVKSDSGCCSSVCFSTLMLRLALGGLLFFLGLGKFLMGTSNFVSQFSSAFESSWLPMGLVTLVLTAIPYVEVCVGALLFAGLFTRWAAVAAGFFFVILIFGGAISGNADIFSSNFIHLFAAAWLVKKPTSSVSIDKLLGCKTC